MTLENLDTLKKVMNFARGVERLPNEIINADHMLSFPRATEEEKRFIATRYVPTLREEVDQVIGVMDTEYEGIDFEDDKKRILGSMADLEKRAGDYLSKNTGLVSTTSG